ncbi:type II toxin-antitoxin system MqsA family antitoxin [Anaeromicropila populeti]|uniref:YgiT-type zinc finger domain-containing protein n=1 Tax=Anaeromicropila populeti TaxID=37658 RepID=A0A1I6ICH6_9FIRM|nr:type II toxin-antitoxin system MqsA family antitoxin [Anaeromicropila populeti]SFR64408.1 YgiT-type zinc finger domain-containing protein [Anaeromicropila populeti]
MRCMSCKTEGMIDASTTYFAQLNNCYVIIEHVPCKKCDQCGEEFITVSVMEKIDEILERIEKVSSKVFIMNYHTAA